MKTQKTRFAGFILFVLAASGLFLTCEVGLGNSVDTKPPTVSVEYPPVDSIIKNTFTMKGKSADETLLKAVSVALTNTANANLSYGPFAATLDSSNKTWSVFINKKNPLGNFSIPDGSYQATITAVDGAGRTSVATTTYKIDNTAPVLVLQSPSTLGSDTTPSSFGRNLKLSGMVSDSNSVKNLVFTAYDSTTLAPVGAPQIIESIPPNIDITFSDAYYQTLYPDPDSPVGDKKYSFSISVTDYAQEYLPETPTGNGNTSSNYYIYSKIYSSVFGSTPAYTMTDLQNIFNGSLADTNNIKAVLAATAVSCAAPTAAASSGSFTINPANNPSFAAQTFDPLAGPAYSSSVYTSVAKNSTMGLQVLVGLDNVPIVENSIGVVLYYMSDGSLSPLDDSGNLLPGAIPITLLTGIRKNANTADAAADAIARAADLARVHNVTEKDNVPTASGSNYLLSVYLPDTVEARRKYCLVVTGYDSNQKDISSGSKRYGFTVASNGVPPAITALGDDTLTFNTNGTLNYSGTITCDNGYASLKYDLSVDGSPVSSGVSIPGLTSGVRTLQNWSLNLTPSTITKSGEYTLKVTAMDFDNNSSSVIRRVYVDFVPPTINLNDPSPIVSQSGISYVNGTVTISGNLGDNYQLDSANCIYTVTNAASPLVVIKTDALPTPLSSWSFDIDTKTLTDNSDYVVAINAKDKAGNSSTQPLTLHVRQSTDKPVLSYVNLVSGKAYPPLPLNESYPNNLGSTMKLSGTITDDDGVAVAKVLIAVAADANKDGNPDVSAKPGHSGDVFIDSDYLPATGLPSADNKSVGFSEDLSSLSEGYYVLQMRVGDIYSSASYTASNNWTQGPIEKFVVDKAPPAVTIDQAQDQFHGTSFTLSGTAIDTGTGISDLDADTKPDILVNGVKVPIDATGKWTTTIDPSTGFTEGSNPISIVCTDKVGQPTYTSFTFKKDTINPSISAFTSLAGWQRTQTIPITVTATDLDTSGLVDKASGVAKVEYQIRTGISPAYIYSGWNTLTRDGTTNNYKGTIGFTEGGSNLLQLKATDLAGNESTVTNQTVQVDATAPTCTVTPPASVNYVNGKSGLAVNVSGTDGTAGVCSGMSKISASLNAAVWSDIITPVDISSGSAIYTIPAATINTLSSGVNTIYFRTTDAALNVSSVATVNLFVDKIAPTLTIASHTSDGLLINKNVSFSGSTTEANSLASVKVMVLKASSTLSATSILAGHTYRIASPGTTAFVSLGASANTTGVSFVALAAGTGTGTVNEWIDTGATTGTFNWSSSVFDTTDTATWPQATYDADGAAGYQIRAAAIATDSAGNTGSAERLLTIDQNSDRPTIKITTLSANNGILKYGDNAQISGTVSDDDSTSSNVVGTFIVSGIPITSPSGATGTTTYTPTTGEWTYKPADITDGPKTVYFYVVDNNGAIFYTGNSSTLSDPYIQFKSGAAADNTSVTTYKSDSTAPAIQSVGGSYGNTAAVGTNVGSLTISLCLGGPNNRYLKIASTSTDANGINGMKLTVVDTLGATQYSLATSVAYGTAVSGSFTPTTDSTPAVWTTDAIDLSSIATGAVSVTVTVYDQCGLYSNSTGMFNLDNTAPAVTVMSPLSSDEETGSITVTGSTSDTGSAGVSSIAWLVPSLDDRALLDPALAALSTWQNTMPITATLTAWEFDFNGSDSIKKPLLTRYDSENTDGKTYALSSVGGIYTLPLYFKITDGVGNVKIFRTYTIKHNPDGDRPVTKITYPSAADYASGHDYVTLGGTIRVNGTASDNVSVSRVYVQIDWNGDGVFDANDQTYVASSHKYDTVLATYATSAIASGVASADQSSWWGIKASNTTGWSINLNGNGELNPTASLFVSGFPSLRDVSIRACSVDNNNKAGAWTDPVKIRIDSLAPKVGSSVQQINRYANGALLANIPAATPIDSSDYKADMYLKGQWYLVTSVEDESGIYNYTVKKGGTTLVNGTDYKAIAHSWTAATTTSGFILYIPLATADGAQDYTVSAIDADATSHTTDMPYTVQIDNTAPALTTLKGNGVPLTSSTPIQDSNYRFTLASDAKDSGSGFKRALVYFYRDQNGSATGANRRMYDPMINYSTSPTTSKVSVLDATGAIISGLTKEEPVPGTPLYGVTCSRFGSSDTTTTFTASSGLISANLHIRKGGVIEIGGSYRLITAITGDMVTFTPGTPTTNTSAFFPYAQVVDNTVAENVSWSGGVYTIDSGDDGDNMPESISKSGTTWSWEATLYSKYIPDGPITAVCFTFDDVGNVSVTTVPTNIQNNRPRLSKLYFGTDLNGDAKYSDSEFETYDMYKVEGDYQSSFNLKTAGYSSVSTGGTVTTSTRGAFKVKDTLAVVPEFVGGNSPIDLVYTQDASSVSGAQTGSGPAVRSPSTKSSYTPGSNNTIMTAASQMYVLSNLDVTGQTTTYTEGNDGVNKKMAFTFWDSTDETTPGANSQNAFLKVTDFTVDVTDGNKPKVVINPFYWNGKTDNSLYDAVNGNGQANGHIELPDDLPATPFVTGNTVKENDRDPKVSGKIVLRGTAYDDQRLSSLWMHFDNFTPTNYLATAGNYGATGVVTIGTSPAITYYKVAQYDSVAGTWTIAAATMAADNWAFTVSALPADGAYFNQTGHKVFWTLSIDTSKMKDLTQTTPPPMPAALNVNARIIAVDHVTGTGNDSETTAGGTAGVDSTYNVPVYQMDVVPYISGVKTSLSTLKQTLSSVYDRTALGHYPVNSTLNAYFYGFNLAAGATVSDLKANTTTLGNADTTTFTGYTVYPAAVSNLKSGAVSITVNSAVSLNNTNSNEAKGSYAGTSSSATGDYIVYSNYYDRQPNNDNNNLLTDDVALDVWNIKNSARSKSGTLTEPIMRIVPADTATANDVMRFAFTNGADCFSMAPAGSVQVSYQDWEKNYADFNNVAFAYDSEGNSYGIATGLDTYPSGKGTYAGRLTFISSRWGACLINNMNDNYYGYHKLRLESIGIMYQAYVQGTPLSDDYIMDTRRFSSPVLTTAVHGAATTSVYCAYFDKFQKQIRFRYGTFDSTTGTTATSAFTTNSTSMTGGGNFGQFVDQHAQGDSANGTATTDPHFVAGTTDVARYAFDAARTDYSLIAGKDAKTGVDTGNAAGKYVAIDVVVPDNTDATKDVVVAVWYDGSNLKYSYLLNPYSGHNADQVNHTASPAGYWSTPITIFTSGGKFCAIKVDSNKGIHIAAQASNQDLKYAYLKTYDAPYSDSTNAVTVDSYDNLLTQIQIDTETEGTNIIPYISYLDGATMIPKMAYLVPQTTMDYTAGGTNANNNLYTGKWEETLVPTSSEVQDDHINIGLWKTKAGDQRTSVGGPPDYTDHVVSGTGYAYGNGTANAVVGYAIVNGTQGYIETAQKN